MKRQIEFTRGIGNKRTDPRTKKKRIYEKKKQMERCSTIFERVISRVISISFSFARPSYLYNWDMSNRRGNEERSKIEEHGQFANQFSIKLLEFSVCVFVSENLERGNTSRLGFRLEEEEKETRLINWQIVARYSSRPRRNDSLELRLFHLSFPLQLCWTRRDSLEAISSKINRNGYDTRFPGTARRFPRGRPPPWCWKRSMERCQLLDSQGSGSLIVAGN